MTVMNIAKSGPLVAISNKISNAGVKAGICYAIVILGVTSFYCWSQFYPISDTLNQALQINPQVAEILATRGKLFLLRAHSVSTADRMTAAHQAETSFVEAIKIKASLNKLYAKDLEEARKLKSYE